MPMSESIEQLLDEFDMSNYVALEFFGGKGRYQTNVIARKVKTIHVWEIYKPNESELRKNVPSGIIRIGDSFDMMKESQYHKMFDLINYDDSPRVFGSEKYCEHFEAIENFHLLLKDEGVIITNLVLNPMYYLLFVLNVASIKENYGNILIQPLKILNWFRRRSQFYGSNRVSLEKATKKYISIFKKHGYVPIKCLISYRNKYLLSILFQLKVKS